MFCGSCGGPIPENSRFCANCGAPVDQAAAPVKGGAAAQPPRAQYIPPGQPVSSPPFGPNRTVLWAGIAMAALVIIAAAVTVPLVLRSHDDGATMTTVATTASSTAGSDTTVTSPTAPPATAVASGPVGDSSGAWVEVGVPGGPWGANDVAVSDDALLIHTYDSGASVDSLYAVMLDSGDIIPLAEGVEAQWGMDIDGRLAVWWEAAGWDDAAMAYAEQHIYSRLLPGGARTEVAGGGAVSKRLPQIAQALVTWVEGAPWPDNPMEYESERTFAAYYRSNGAGSNVVARGYGGSYEQVLGANPDAWWMSPPIAVSSRHIAFIAGNDLHLFEWQAH